MYKLCDKLSMLKIFLNSIQKGRIKDEKNLKKVFKNRLKSGIINCYRRNGISKCVILLGGNSQ